MTLILTIIGFLEQFLLDLNESISPLLSTTDNFTTFYEFCGSFFQNINTWSSSNWVLRSLFDWAKLYKNDYGYFINYILDIIVQNNLLESGLTYSDITFESDTRLFTIALSGHLELVFGNIIANNVLSLDFGGNFLPLFKIMSYTLLFDLPFTYFFKILNCITIFVFFTIFF